MQLISDYSSRVLFFLFCLLSVVSRSSVDVEQMQELEDLVVFVRQSRSDVEAAAYRVEEAEHEEMVIRSNLFPHMQLTGTVQKTRENIYPSEMLQASFSQVLYDPSGARIEEEIAKCTTKIQRENYLNVKDEAEFETTNSFLTYRNRLLEEDLEKSLDSSSSQYYQKALLAAQVGFISPVQLQKAEAKFKASQSSVAKLFHTRIIAKDQLEANSEKKLECPLSITNARKLVDFIVQVTSSYDTESLVRDAYESVTEFEILDLERQQAEYELDKNRYAYLPSISFVANAYKTRFDIDPTLSPTQRAALDQLIYPWTVGIQGSWTFDSFGHVQKMREAKARILEKTFDKKRLEFTVRGEVETLHEELKISVEQIKAAVSKAEELDEDYAKASLELEVGLVAPVDYARVETDWRQAHTELENIIASSVIKHEELLRRAGYPYTRTTLFDYLKKGSEKRENL